MKPVVLILALACAGCAAPEIHTVYVPQEVVKPVPVPCAAEQPPEPEWTTKSLVAADDIDTKVRALLAEREQRIGYEEKLRAAIEGCKK